MLQCNSREFQTDTQAVRQIGQKNGQTDRQADKETGRRTQRKKKDSGMYGRVPSILLCILLVILRKYL